MSKSTKKASKKIEPFMLANIKAANFQKLLEERGACAEAREWAAKKSLKQVLKTCNTHGWLNWLFNRMTNPYEQYSLTNGYYTNTKADIKAWGGRGRVQGVIRAARRAYSKAYAAEPESVGFDVRYNCAQKAGADVFRQYYTVA